MPLLQQGQLVGEHGPSHFTDPRPYESQSVPGSALGAILTRTPPGHFLPSVSPQLQVQYKIEEKEKTTKSSAPTGLSRQSRSSQGGFFRTLLQESSG